MTYAPKPEQFKVEDQSALPVPLPVGGRVLSRFSRRWLLACVVIAVLAGAGAYGRYYWETGRFLQSTDDAYVQADSTIVAPKISGYLRDVLVGDNQPVKAGQVLAQAKADVATAQADIDNAKAALTLQQAVIAQTRATVEADRASLTFAEQE